MKKTLCLVHAYVCVAVLLMAGQGYAEHFTACLAEMPVGAENQEKGILVDLVNRWAEVTGNEITITTYPFKRSIMNVKNKSCDFHLPLIENPYKHPGNLDFDYSTSVILTTDFVLYTNKDHPIDVTHLERYNITTDAAHIEFFDFPIKGDFKIESSLKKLSAHRIDGYIYANVPTEPVLLALGLKNIKQQFYKSFNVRAVLPKGQKGGAADRMITEAMEIIKADGSWDRIMEHVNLKYTDWQP